jgi:hypothetical protein
MSSDGGWLALIDFESQGVRVTRFIGVQPRNYANIGISLRLVEVPETFEPFADCRRAEQIPGVKSQLPSDFILRKGMRAFD